MSAALQIIRTAAFAVALATFSRVGSAADRPETNRPAAKHAATVSCSADLAVPIRMYNRSHMTAGDLDAVLHEANSLWEPYGITLVRAAERGVSVIVADGLSDESRTNSGRLVLGTTMFTDGHADPYIHLWVGAADQVLEFDRARPASSLTAAEHTAALQSILGVALAHELGHYLLDTPHHGHDGLLHDVLSVRDMQHPTIERLGLTASQQHVLCATPATVQRVDALREGR